MGVNKEEISTTILELEKSFNERWSVGDNRGYLDAFADEVSYFDPILENILVGRDKVIAWIDSIYSNPNIVRNEYLNPQVHVSDDGDLAVLGYNLNTFVLDENGEEKQLRSWNASHGYKLIDGQWRIVHSNWAFSQTVTEKIAS
ncbi:MULTISPECIES: YybH family protein [Streptomyces]|uniref:Nuclear transport factor 2 family protein n=1 Tax=Streptomyces caniscabiei TaxID=2746961 RepID=A0ABU4N4T3_9ACTN|nr:MULTISPECIES: nuclear transport factor 2 family protein [Streptomyces]MBE4733307.1 nuclear transport factor 2 family protein [Streptomyces caniscabiei]MBE4754484.1 nuclear transport factor 2 family protein [Streptomyces caniscabiei]MBE4768695.1 nuclear transport factor 2 family protein [Streptomyces caniscabiei]MBE4781802.1 nuclear transport factor 2 family protein [Streptomyces caniscabiei]MBE4793092.1 nuclear transport factor 2 family protein [Streptomyces caniscabiei]